MSFCLVCLCLTKNLNNHWTEMVLPEKNTLPQKSKILFKLKWKVEDRHFPSLSLNLSTP